MRCLRCFYISNASHQNNSCWRKLSHTCTLLSLFTLGDSMSDRRRARQNHSRKYWMTRKTYPIFMTGPLLKCWIIDYKKPTSRESWDLQKLFDSSEKVKANFKTEIKVARNERMWSQAWNPEFPSHKIPRPANRPTASVIPRNKIVHLTDDIEGNILTLLQPAYLSVSNNQGEGHMIYHI